MQYLRSIVKHNDIVINFSPVGQDLADVISRQLSDQTKTRRQIVARLIFLNIIVSAKQLKQMT